MDSSTTAPEWSTAPDEWNWLAQDEDGRWFWYKAKPVLGIGGGVWRSPSRGQVFASQGDANPAWYETLRERPA